MSDCKHLNFHTEAKIARLTSNDDSETITGYHMDLTVHCTDCMKPFMFVGLPGGFSPSYPTTCVEGIEARIPIKPVC